MWERDASSSDGEFSNGILSILNIIFKTSATFTVTGRKQETFQLGEWAEST